MFKGLEPVAGLMTGHTTHADLRVLGINPAEHDQCLGVGRNHGPHVLCGIHQFEKVHPEHMGDDRLCGRRTVATKRRYKPAERI